MTQTPVIIDVSAHQPALPWEALRDAGVQGALLKATEGVGFEDAAFARHRAGAARAGIPTGAYHFARPDTVTSRHDAVAEADWFVHVARPAEGDLLPALDFETPGLAPRELLQWALAWLQRVSAAIGERPLFYTYPNFVRERLPDAAPLANRSLLWLADWGPNDGVPHPAGPIGRWRGVALHQFTSRGVLPGVRGPVDLSRLGPGITLDAIRIGATAPGPARYGAPLRSFAGGRLVAVAAGSWGEARFQERTRAAARRHPFVVLRGTPRDGTRP